MNEVLLTVLNETLDDLSKQIKVTQGTMERLREEVEVWKKDVANEEDRWKCARYEEE